jgi:hypothetical protein
MRSCSQAPAASAMRCAPAELDLSIGSFLVSVIVFGPRKKKPAWWNTLRYSTTPAYSSTGPPAKPECPLSSRPTKPAHVLLGFARSLTQAIPIEYYCPTWSVNSKGSFSISHMKKSRMIVDYRFGLDRDRTHALDAAAEQESRHAQGRTANPGSVSVPGGDPVSILPAGKEE